MNILIVEDEAIIAMRMQMELKKLGHNVYKPFSSGERAIESIKKEKPDIVILDLHLRGKMNGIETARKMYEIPVIFMTGYQDANLKKEAMELNPVAYLIKPVEVDEIQAAIDSAKKSG